MISHLSTSLLGSLLVLNALLLSLLPSVLTSRRPAIFIGVTV